MCRPGSIRSCKTRTISTDAALVLSASAFPLGRACGHAAAQLTDGVGWVTGSAPAFNNDRYAPETQISTKTVCGAVE